MHLTKVIISNFKCFGEKFILDLNPRLNILVGDNEAGKSTILEAIHLALSGWIFGKYLKTELTQSLFNNNAVEEYIKGFSVGQHKSPPKIVIELHMEIEEESIRARFEGNQNSINKKSYGIKFEISFNEKYKAEYESMVKTTKITSLPIEYYDFSWSSFAREENITPRIIPIKSAYIDSSRTRFQNGSDVYISRIIRDFLDDDQRNKISQAHRDLKELFANDVSVSDINKQLNQKEISDKKVALSVNLSTKTAWESSLTSFFDDIPFDQIGSGEQCMIKTKLALEHKKAKEANILLIEEPENHLSYSKLNKLIHHIKSNSEKQIIISTHNSFVANKLGLENLILLGINETSKEITNLKINDLEPETRKYFEKLPGYDTLRMVLCKKSILVEGPSDELIVQKAYMNINHGKLPIEDEIDVISVGTSFLRFLEIGEKINNKIHVVTDNDGDFDTKITKKYEKYADSPTIKIYSDKDNTLRTLEPQIVEANITQLDILRCVLGISREKYPDKESIITYMINNKTETALTIFLSDENINTPKYILDAIG